MERSSSSLDSGKSLLFLHSARHQWGWAFPTAPLVFPTLPGSWDWRPTPRQSPPHSWDDLFRNHLKVAVLPGARAPAPTTLFPLNFPLNVLGCSTEKSRLVQPRPSVSYPPPPCREHRPGPIASWLCGLWTRPRPFKGSGNLCRSFQLISQLHPVTSPVSNSSFSTVFKFSETLLSFAVSHNPQDKDKLHRLAETAETHQRLADVRLPFTAGYRGAAQPSQKRLSLGG